jgi:G3E family GTPase
MLREAIIAVRKDPGDLMRSLVEIAQAPEPPNAILLEASGAADPRGIAQIALANPALSLAGIVTLIDAENFRDHLAEPDVGALMRAQIAAGDILTLNKMDLVGDSAAEIRAAIARLADGRPVVETTRSNLPADVVFGAHARSAFHADEPVKGGHSRAFRSWSLVWNGPPAEDRLVAALSEMPASVLRAKGIFHFAGKPTPLVYQRAGRRWSFAEGDGIFEPSGRSRLVVIGLAADGDRIERYIEDALRAL